MQLDLPGGEVIFQAHIQLRYFLDKPLQHQGTVGAVRPIPPAEQVLLFRQQHPYQANGVTDDARQSAFGLLNTCLTEMCCTTDTQSYRGALVTADKVLAEISCASNGCEEDGLEPYVEDVLDTFLQAITTRKVKNLPQYMKSLLWTSFATYKLNTISGITAPYKEVKNVYGLH